MEFSETLYSTLTPCKMREVTMVTVQIAQPGFTRNGLMTDSYKKQSWMITKSCIITKSLVKQSGTNMICLVYMLDNFMLKTKSIFKVRLVSGELQCCIKQDYEIIQRTKQNKYKINIIYLYTLNGQIIRYTCSCDSCDWK